MSLTESCTMIKKSGNEQEPFTCIECNKVYKQCIGFYEADNATCGAFLCVKCHDGPQKFKEVVSTSHCCPYYSKEPCELVFEYSETLKYNCDLCGAGPFNGVTGRFCCKQHGFNVCWECSHPPFSFIVCPFHPYVKLDNEASESDKPYNCQVCQKSGKAKEGRYHCPIIGCKYEICWKCFTVPVYFDFKDKDKDYDDKDKEIVNDKEIDDISEEAKAKKELDERIGEGYNDEENKATDEGNHSISHEDFDIEFHIDKDQIEVSPSVGNQNEQEINDPKLIHIDA